MVGWVPSGWDWLVLGLVGSGWVLHQSLGFVARRLFAFGKTGSFEKDPFRSSLSNIFEILRAGKRTCAKNQDLHETNAQ